MDSQVIQTCNKWLLLQLPHGQAPPHVKYIPLILTAHERQGRKREGESMRDEGERHGIRDGAERDGGETERERQGRESEGRERWKREQEREGKRKQRVQHVRLCGHVYVCMCLRVHMRVSNPACACLCMCVWPRILMSVTHTNPAE